MTTYSTLVSKALILSEQEDVTSAQDVAEIAIIEALKYVATKVYVPELIGSATYTWTSLDTSISLVSDFGVSLSVYAGPARLYVNEIPYDYRDYLVYLDLKNVASGDRVFITQPLTSDENPDRVYTIDLSNNIIPDPEPVDGQDVVFYYHKMPAAYASGGTPEIAPSFDSLLVNGTVLWLKEWLRDPEQIINPYELFQKLDPQIKEMDLRFASNRRRDHIRLSKSYRIPY